MTLSNAPPGKGTYWRDLTISQYKLTTADSTREELRRQGSVRLSISLTHGNTF